MCAKIATLILWIYDFLQSEKQACEFSYQFKNSRLSKNCPWPPPFFFSISVTHLQKPKAWTSLKVDQKKHTCLTYGVGLVAYLLIIFSVSSCMISSVLSQAVLASCSTTQGSRATCDVLPAPAHDRASPIVNCTSTCRICSVRKQRLVGTVLLWQSFSIECHQTNTKVMKTVIQKKWKYPKSVNEN